MVKKIDDKFRAVIQAVGLFTSQVGKKKTTHFQTD